MTFNTALSSPEYTQLRRTRWYGNQYVSLVDNVVALSGQVALNYNAAGGTSAMIGVAPVLSGAIANIDESMVVIVSPTSDMRDPQAVRLHVREGITDGSSVYVSEFSDALTAGDYIWVLYAYDMIDNLSRPVGSNPVVQYKSFDIPFERMAPVIVGARLAYVDWVDANGYYTIAFDLSATFAAEYGATIASYVSAVFPTGSGTYTVTAGSLATNTFTLRFTYGEYWLRLAVVDNNGATSIRHVLIKAHDPDNYPPLTDFDGIELTRDINQGPSARIHAFAGVSTLVNGTMAVIWVDEQYSDADFTNTAGSLINNIDLVGWIESEENMFQTDPTYSAYATVQFEVQGVGARLSRLEGQLLAITNSASPSVWDQINNLTVWRAIVHFLQRHTTALQLCDFTSDSTDLTYLFPTITTMAGRALDNVSGGQGIADEINAQIEFAADGRMQLVRRAPFVLAEGGTPTTIATWLNQDIVGDLKWSFPHYLQYGYLDADGAVWDGSSAAVVPFLSRAPGLAQTSGPDTGRLNNQILASTTDLAAAQAELSRRAGCQWNVLNNNGTITANHPDGYHWLLPSFGQVYQFSLDTTSNIRSYTFANNFLWMIKQVTVRHDNAKGTRDVQATYVPAQAGFTGVTVPIINEGSIEPALPLVPDIPAFDLIEYPETTIPDTGLDLVQAGTTAAQITPATSKVTRDGQVVVEIHDNGAKLSITKTYILLTSPQWIDITPTLPAGYALVDVAFNQFAASGKAAVYALANDGTDSVVFYNPDTLGAGAWSQGATVSGVYTALRCGNAAGKVLIYTPGTSYGSGTYTFDFTANDGGWQSDNSVVAGSTYVPGTGWTSVPGSGGRVIGIKYVIAATITSLSFTFHFNSTPDDGHGDARYGSVTFDDHTGGTLNGTWGNTGSSVATLLQLVSGNGTSSGAGNGATYTITAASFTSSDPFSTNAAVRYSSDYGATFGNEVVVGTVISTGIGGFDTARASGVSVAACGHAITRATTLGGAYSALATFASSEVTCAVIPYYRLGSDVTSQTTSSTPDVLVGLDTEESSTCLFIVDGSGTKTAITTPVAGATVTNQHCLTTLRGKKVAGIFKVGSDYRLYVTENLASGGTATWTYIKDVTVRATVRSRRNDPRTGNHRGQLYLWDTTTDGYSSQWAYSGEKTRVGPVGVAVSGDVL